MMDTNLKSLGERLYNKLKHLDEPNPQALKSLKTQWQHNRRVIGVKDYKYMARNVFGRRPWNEVISYRIHIMDYDTPLFGCFEQNVTITRIKIN